METRLYLLCYRWEALVASQLSPERFGSYMAVGTRRRTSGRVIFFEVDPERIDKEYFDVEGILARVAPHDDGEPKRSQYVSVYRVLEHIPLDALRKLYLVTQDGVTLGLDGEDAIEEGDSGEHMYVELCPVGPRVVSSLPPVAFSRFITDPANPVRLPRVFFADSIVERDADGRLASYLPYRDHEHIMDCLEEVRGARKKAKTVERVPLLLAFYRTVKTGFFAGDPTGCKLFRFPTKERLEDELHLWWRSAQLG